MDRGFLLSRSDPFLTHDGIQAGYELDNRLAKNRDTPPEALCELSERIEQDGAQMLLAKNPRTPEDVLTRLRVPRR
jgi:hypothetical protein